MVPQCRYKGKSGQCCDSPLQATSCVTCRQVICASKTSASAYFHCRFSVIAELAAQGARGRLAKAEQALDALLDAQLRSRQHDPQQDDCSDSDSFPADPQDDYVDSDAADTDSNDSLQAAEPLHSRVIARQESRSGPGLGVKAGASKHCTPKQPVWQSVVDDSNPPSFSQVELSRPEKEIHTCFPMFPVGASAAVILQSPFLKSVHCLVYILWW